MTPPPTRTENAPHISYQASATAAAGPREGPRDGASETYIAIWALTGRGQPLMNYDGERLWDCLDLEAVRVPAFRLGGAVTGAVTGSGPAQPGHDRGRPRLRGQTEVQAVGFVRPGEAGAVLHCGEPPGDSPHRAPSSCQTGPRAARQREQRVADISRAAGAAAA